MVRDPKDPSKWEDWEIRNTLEDIKKELKKTDITSRFLLDVYLGVIIGIAAGFFGSMLFSFLTFVDPNLTALELGITLVIFFILFVLFFFFVFRHIRKRIWSLRYRKDILHPFTLEGRRERLEAMMRGKSFAEMSPEEEKEMWERSGGVEVEPGHWVFGKKNIKKWRKENKKKKK